jgi:hypothetical protein
MVAKRFGEITNSLTGNGGSYLKVKEDETGFEFQHTEPIGDWIQSYAYYEGDLVIVSLQVYRCKTQHTSSSVFANDSANWDAVMIGPTGPTGATGATGAGGLSVFTWSTSEQTWPFEKSVGGDTLYCKQIALGAGPNNGTKTVAHNITGYDKAKMFRLEGTAIYDNSITNFSMMPYGGGGTTDVAFWINSTNIVMNTTDNYSAGTCIARVIYWK